MLMSQSYHAELMELFTSLKWSKTVAKVNTLEIKLELNSELDIAMHSVLMI